MNYKKKGLSSNIVLMLTLLGIILILMFLINKRKTILSDFRPSLEQFEGQAAVIKNRYMNRPYRFSISAPDSLWHFSYSANVDSTSILQGSEFDPFNLVTVSRDFAGDTVAVVKAGVFRRQGELSPQQIAARSLRHVVETRKTASESVNVVADVTVAQSANLSSYFYVVEFPLNSPHPYPVRVVMFVLWNDVVYRILCQVRRESYEEFRTDFEYFLKSFSFI
ncbi:hypothetical protein GF337_18005 [candidate division KSB1 bacterium]|nr:hypothetical protein [candidate division KSB1 bacterium]